MDALEWQPFSSAMPQKNWKNICCYGLVKQSFPVPPLPVSMVWRRKGWQRSVAKLSYFANGFQSSKLLGDQRYWRIPVADGEFVVEESFGIGKGVGGGNLIILGTEQVKSPRRS